MAAPAHSRILSRRQAIGRFGAASAAIAALSCGVPAKSMPPLEALIEAHKTAKSAFDDICCFEDDVAETDPRHAVLSAEYEVRDSVEDDALTALCAYRPETIAEVRQRGEYLANHAKRGVFQPHQLDALLDSFAA